jgi:hypothetical protein
MKLDIGCGPNKRAGFFGIDIHAYEQVDMVQDLTHFPWNIESASCTEIYANQVIEHMPDLRAFIAEIYRIAADGCRITLTTPHYISHNSWADPTHIHHLSVAFCKPFTEGYLAAQLPGFSVSRAKITFGSFFWTWPGRLICALFGTRFYEKRFCWIFPASSVVVELTVNRSAQ